jgi:catechol 2,3-dioxygenase-like lactoylglutathione lyase family enzyme
MAFGIQGIDHVQIAVPEALEGQCLAFYRELLGLAEIEKPEHLKSRGGAWFQVGAVQMHVGIDPETSPKSKRHVCFRVADLARARAQALAAGATLEDEGKAEGLIRFFLRDPAGNRVEIGERV